MPMHVWEISAYASMLHVGMCVYSYNKSCNLCFVLHIFVFNIFGKLLNSKVLVLLFECINLRRMTFVFSC